jgi:hypothetical protein
MTLAWVCWQRRKPRKVFTPRFIKRGSEDESAWELAVVQSWLAVLNAFPTLLCILVQLKRTWNTLMKPVYFVNPELEMSSATIRDWHLIWSELYVWFIVLTLIFCLNCLRVLQDTRIISMHLWWHSNQSKGFRHLNYPLWRRQDHLLTRTRCIPHVSRCIRQF